MSKQENPAYESYKKLIQEIAVDAKKGGGGPRIEKRAIFSGIVNGDVDVDRTPYNEFIASLSDEDRKLLVNMLKAERIEAFHDCLAQFTYAVDLDGLGFTHNGKRMPVGIEGGLHQDFMGFIIIGGYTWPDI